MTIFERYKPIVADWDAFMDAVRAPLPVCIWTNMLRADPKAVFQKLCRAGFRPKEVSWYPGAFRMPADFGAGTHIAYWAGLYHVQEEVAMLPAALLAPKPGDLALDLCAAPGNKTAQISVLMRNQGMVIANEINGRRMQPIRQSVNRLGLLNVITSNADATAFPNQEHQFDCVMADVACSCEGTSRKNPEILTQNGSKHWEKIQSSQIAILKRALQLCKPGGRVAYATCTYAPEENEMVIQKVLDELAPKIPVSILECEMKGLSWSPGLEFWEGRRFRRDMKNACRIYPHQNDTGGFFVAILRKEDDLRRSTPGSVRRQPGDSRVKPVEPELLIEFLQSRFGFATDLLQEFELFRTNQKIASIMTRNSFRLQRPRPESIGLPFVHLKMAQPKITTAAAMCFGRYAKKHILDMTAGQVRRYLAGARFAADRNQIDGYDAPGPIILKFAELFLGTGILRLNGRSTVVQGQFPKAWTRTADCGHGALGVADDSDR